MKAVIIAESQNIIDEFSQYYKSNGFDVIVYRWLMKAMDNIEEIDPDLIFINAEEYPRHWKILCQYVAGINKFPKIVLYSSRNFKDEENEKAKLLNIDSVINSSEDLQEVCTLEELCPTTNEPENEIEPASEVEPENEVESASEIDSVSEVESASEIDSASEVEPASEIDSVSEVESASEIDSVSEVEPASEIESASEIETENEVEPENKVESASEVEPASEIKTEPVDTTVEENKTINCKFLFTHPKTFVLITGTVKEFGIPKLIFIPDNPDDTKDLAEETIINRCTLKIDGSIKTVNAKIIKNSNEIEFVI